jgi:NADPH-dependent 2,4-dienoyl-CoA reductase/sulfur reductase-like enzyme
MEAARVLALRGYKVVLFEKDSQLGGQLNLANKPLGKEKINWLIEFLSYELNRLNVDVRLNTEATIEKIKAEGPYAVFAVTGAKPFLNKSFLRYD